MISLISLAVVLFLVAVIAYGWFRGWSMLLTTIVAMTGAFIVGVSTSARLGDSLAGSPLLTDLAWRPEYLSLGAWSHWPTALTTMFLHADVAHIFVNVLVYAFMGLGYEERVGRGRFLVTFVVSGLLGTVLHSVTNLGGFESQIPVVGASGAVFGIMGAYATLFPRDRVVLFVFIILPNVPVYIAVIVYSVMELIALGALNSGSGVAQLAHIGGLIGGALVAFAFMRTGSVERHQEGQRSKPLQVSGDLESLIRTDAQRDLYQRVKDNHDEPEVATAWLEKLARATPCPDCGKPLEATNGSLRSECGFKLVVARTARK